MYDHNGQRTVSQVAWFASTADGASGEGSHRSGYVQLYAM